MQPIIIILLSVFEKLVNVKNIITKKKRKTSPKFILRKGKKSSFKWENARGKIKIVISDHKCSIKRTLFQTSIITFSTN